MATAIDVLGALVALAGLMRLCGQVAAGMDRPSDFTAYFLAARGHALGLDYYRRETLEALAAAAGLAGDLGPYLYPPLFAAVLSPLAQLDYPVARWLWAAGEILALAFSLHLLRAATGLRLGRGWRGPALAFVVLFPPTGDDLLKGQVTSLLLLLCAGAWLAQRRARPEIAGVLLAVATALKVAPGLLLLYLALRRDWRALGAAAAAGAALLGLSLLLAGPERHAQYLRDTLPSIGVQVGALANVSLPGLLARLFAPDSLFGPLLANASLHVASLGVALVAVAVVCARAIMADARVDAGRAWGFPLAVTAMLLVSPSSQAYTLLLAVVALALLLARFRSVAGPAAWRTFDLLAVAAMLLSVPPDLQLNPGLAAACGLPTSPAGGLAFAIAALPTIGLLALFAALASLAQAPTERRAKANER